MTDVFVIGFFFHMNVFPSVSNSAIKFSFSVVTSTVSLLSDTVLLLKCKSGSGLLSFQMKLFESDEQETAYIVMSCYVKPHPWTT